MFSLHPFGSQRRVYSTYDQNFEFKIRRDHQKKSYECHVYEPVDIRSLYRVISHRFTECSSQEPKGYACDAGIFVCWFPTLYIVINYYLIDIIA